MLIRANGRKTAAKIFSFAGSAGYQKNQVKDKRKTKEDILAKYFTPRKTSELFRILPYKTKDFYVEAFFHVVDAPLPGGKIKHGGTNIYCPAHNDPKIPKLDADGKPMVDGNGKPMMVPAPCPLCAKAKQKLAQQDQSIRNIKKDDLNDAQKVIWENNRKIFMDASKWEAKKYYIVRGIDRGSEGSGVKFWRFKHNFKNQGTLDKLYPILDVFCSEHGVGFEDPYNGTNLNIIMADTTINGFVYKTITAITARGKSPRHSDPIIMRQWLEDDITWRDVFQPKKAPGVTPYEYMVLVAKGQTPYWDDSDSNNKHWVFPGNPELETKANTRSLNLDNDDDDFEQASDLSYFDESYVTMNTVTQQNVGTYKDDVVNITAKPEVSMTKTPMNTPHEDDLSNDYDGLPF